MSNNILVITSNPEKDSMTDAVGAAFAAGAVERGASADVLDLYDEGFNPVYSAADRAHYLGHAPMPEDVLLIQRRLAQADVIALVFPIYWYTMPAMVKGLFDRVICRGFAYHPDGTPGRAQTRIMGDCGGVDRAGTGVAPDEPALPARVAHRRRRPQAAGNRGRGICVGVRTG